MVQLDTKLSLRKSSFDFRVILVSETKVLSDKKWDLIFQEDKLCPGGVLQHWGAGNWIRKRDLGGAVGPKALLQR